MVLEQGKLVKWENKQKQQIVFIITDRPSEGVVIHSDYLLSTGTIVNLTDYNDLQPFVGTVHVNSESTS